MSEQYTPTTEEVRDTYEWGVHACGCCATPDEESLARFDRWLAKRDAEVAAKALEEVAETIATALPGSEAVGYYASEVDSGYLEAERDIEGHLRARAAVYRKAVQSE